MRKLLIGVFVTFVLSFPVARAGAGQYRYDFKPERKALKARQKQEWKTLKRPAEIPETLLEGHAYVQSGPRAVEAPNEAREAGYCARDRRNDRQDFKDRQRLMKERMR